jgi:hypothetical protein
MNKYWTCTGKEAKSRDTIESLIKHQSNPIVYTNDSKEMAVEMATYHEKIQLKDINPDEGERAEALDKMLGYIQNAPANIMEHLRTKLTYKEISDAINRSAPGKAPGLHGLPSELYKKIHER